MYAIIKTGGKQYKVSPGQTLKIEKLDLEADAVVNFEEVLLVSNDGNITVGKPLVKGAKVVAKVLSQGKGKKVISFKYKPKKDSKVKKGHRQPYTEIEITSIDA